MAENQHHPLSAGERHQIYVFQQQKLSMRAIAKPLKRSPSTISRELRRNSRSAGPYAPEEATRLVFRRRSTASRRPCKVFPELWASHICPLLRKGWSLDRTAGWLRTQEKGFSLSSRWIYQLIAEDRSRGGDLYTCLRRKGKQRRMQSDAGRIPNRVEIASSPTIVDEKSRVGDWEVALIVGKEPQRRSAYAGGA